MRQGLTKQQIVAQAARLVEEKGLEKLTLASLAERLQIKTPSLYNHIKNLSDLKIRIANYGLELLAGRLIHAALGKARDDALFAVAEAYFDFTKVHPHLYVAIIYASDPLDATFTEISDRVLAALFQILEGYALSGAERVHAIRGLRSIIHGFVSLQMHHGFNMDYDREQSLKWILATYLEGLNMKHKQK